MTLLFDLSEYQIVRGFAMHWEGAEDLDSNEWLSPAILDKEGNLHVLSIALSGRFSISQKSTRHLASAPDTVCFKTNGIYLSPLPITKPTIEDSSPWQVWLLKNWDLNYWKAYHIVVAIDELIINAFTWEIRLDNQPLPLPKHPNR